MTFKTIEYVIAVHEAGSFSRAAQNLFVSQPALSQAIAKAERELGYTTRPLEETLRDEAQWLLENGKIKLSVKKQ